MRNRVRSILDGRGLVDREVAELIGITPQNFSNYLTGQRTVTDKFLVKVSQAIGVPFDTLRYGNEIEKYVTPIDPEPGIFTTGNIGSIRPNLKDYYTPVKLLSARAQMGIPSMTHETFNLNWLEETYPVFMPTVAISERHLVIEVVGDSMTPEIKDRALVLAEAVITNDIKYQSGAVYAVLYAGNNFVVKRIKTNELNVNGTLTLWSDNERYGQVLVHGEDIIHMWKVIEIVKQPVR